MSRVSQTEMVINYFNLERLNTDAPIEVLYTMVRGARPPKDKSSRDMQQYLGCVISRANKHFDSLGMKRRIIPGIRKQSYRMIAVQG